jgi:hypothetical protein
MKKTSDFSLSTSEERDRGEAFAVFEYKNEKLNIGETYF